MHNGVLFKVGRIADKVRLVEYELISVSFYTFNVLGISSRNETAFHLQKVSLFILTF